MAKKMVVVKVGFGCHECKSHDLKSVGAVRTEDNCVYFVFQCEDCGEAVPIGVDAVFAQLYGANETKGSDKVN